MLFSRGSSQPLDEPMSSILQGNSLPSEQPGKPMNTGVGSLSPVGSTGEGSPGDLSNSRIKPGSPALPVDSSLLSA